MSSQDAEDPAHLLQLFLQLIGFGIAEDSAPLAMHLVVTGEIQTD